MAQNAKLKLFISYSHLDERYANDLIKHLAPLKNNGLIEHWYDRKIVPGTDFQDTIDNNLEDADIICILISANFLSSDACIKEKKKALDLKKEKGIAVVPVILSACGWLDDRDISPLLALPTDGKPISLFQDSDTAWLNVYSGLKGVIERMNKIKQLKITESFSSFLHNTELLAKAHSQKDIVLLEDIFVYPELMKYDDAGEYQKKDSSEKLVGNFTDYPKILIAGEDQSGKTTLCKRFFIELRKKNYVPVYISDKLIQETGNMETKIYKSYNRQYGEAVPLEDIDKERIVPIIDDFHLAKHREKHIEDLSLYSHQVIFVDDIFSLNFKDENIVKSFTNFKILEFIPSLRNQLIKNWMYLSDMMSGVNKYGNRTYEGIDNTTELVNNALGKIIGSGIMPAYPFFILSIISIYETFERPLDQEITSQGYCYQALIYMYLRKQGVKNDEIDTYINFLTEIAFHFHTAKKSDISVEEFNSFMMSYFGKYNVPVKQEILLNNLQETQIFALDSFNNYGFCYPYLYYFFVAKYLAEHVEQNKENIDIILKNLHVDENAYIAIFISHHTKNDYVLDEIILNAYSLFDKYKPATLSNNELRFFDKQGDIIAKAVLPPAGATPESERAKILKTQDLEEQNYQDGKKKIVQRTEGNNDLAMELRRSVKTVEVMGRIIKNRAGSLEKSRLEFIFEEAMRVHLRILTSFIEIIKDDKNQQEVVDFISNRLHMIIEDKEKKDTGGKPRPLNREKIEKLSKTVFWNTNFFVVYGFINKLIHSLGSNKLIAIIEKVCDKENTPASFLLKHGILMWFNKNLQVDNIAKRIDEDGFSEISKRIMRFMIVNHCSMHAIGFKEKQKIENRMGIPSQRLQIQQPKESVL